jgi:hypothetical protein
MVVGRMNGQIYFLQHESQGEQHMPFAKSGKINLLQLALTVV